MMRSSYYCHFVKVPRFLFVAHMKLPLQPPTAYSAPPPHSQKFEEFCGQAESGAAWTARALSIV
jgi:hypothetical protein